jgi:PD-(D/E)XK nuclease superfamily
MARRTIVVSARPQFEAIRLELARSDGSGVLVTPVERMATRLAGGLLDFADPDDLVRAVSAVLENAAEDDLGDLAEIRALPGVPRTLATTLRRAWSAGLDLAERAGDNPRLTAMARIESAVLERLKAGQLRPVDVVERAVARLQHAPKVMGAVEFHHLPDLARCWRSLVQALPAVVPVTWAAGPFPVPDWVSATKGILVTRSEPKKPEKRTVSCANPRHEVIEAMRWARSLMASGKAGPHQIAFAAASTSRYDDFVFSLSEECNLDIHFGHGRRALHTEAGQAAAALADVLLRGLSQTRVRRVISGAMFFQVPAVAKLPKDWGRHLPSGAPLNSIEHWERALEGGDKQETATVLLPLIRKMAPQVLAMEAAAEVGETLLNGAARQIWRRALAQAPATALDRELGNLRTADLFDPAKTLAWMPASSLASAPRPYVWLFGLNAQVWPRLSAEDPLLPQRLLGGMSLEETSVATADRVSFEAIEASAECEVVRSYSRREAEGRRLGVSPLVTDVEPEILYRTQVPGHAMSEPDRLMARFEEFALREEAKLAITCWRNWRDPEITPHDGRIDRVDHPALVAALKAPQSAHSLTLLLRNPVGFMWRYALGMNEPDMESDALDMDARAFGILVHEVLDAAVQALSASARWTSEAIEAEIAAQLEAVRARWELEVPAPPMQLWHTRLRRAAVMATNALLFPHELLPGQASFSEVPFGTSGASKGRALPWDTQTPVPVPGTDLTITGYIDRVDIADGKAAARVVDYKTGSNPGQFTLRGGRELQRCLYAFAVSELLGPDTAIEAGLLYPSDEPGDPAAGAYQRLEAPDATLEVLKAALVKAVANLRRGLALPGVAAGVRYKDYLKKGSPAEHESDRMIFALPVVPGTMLGPKKDAAARMFGEDIVKFWEHA